MQEFDTPRLVYLIVLLCMVAGWFFMQARQDMNKSLQHAAIWGLIFVGGAAAVGLWQDISANSGPGQVRLGQQGAVIIPRADDGHYYLSAEVNNVPVLFVVDTGASSIVLTQNDARRVGLNPDELAYRGRASTANGEVKTAFVRLETLQLAQVTDRNVGAVVNGGELHQSLLGMGYLERWGSIEIRNQELILSR